MSRWTQEDVDRLNRQRGVKASDHRSLEQIQIQEPTKSKYRNVVTYVGEERFDSKREADYWLLLKAREALGEIAQLRRQVSYSLLAPVIANSECWREVSVYVADFVYKDALDQREHVVDAKGKRTRMYELKAKWLMLQSGLEIEEV